jgi:hypothetical protein
MYRKEMEWEDVEWIHLARRCLIAGSSENGKEALGSVKGGGPCE